MLDYSHNKLINLGRRVNDKKTFELFRNVNYLVDESLPAMIKTRLRNILQNNGGIPGNLSYDPEEPPDGQRLPEDHVPNMYISQNSLYPYKSRSVVVAVTPLWIDKAMDNGFVHDPMYYSPVLQQFLSGLVLLLLDLPNGNCSPIKNEINRFGGQYRDEFTEDITHLICFDPRGTYYNQCIEQDIPVVLPQWLDDSFRYKRKMDEDLYLVTEPIVHYEHNTTPANVLAYGDKNRFNCADDNYNMVLENEVIYFGQDVNIKEDFKEVLFGAVVRAGGMIADQYSHQYVTIVILKHRSTRECRMASKNQKLITSLWWLTNTLLRGYQNSPLSTLLDYPTPPGGLPGMENVIIAVAGYGNVKRYYLRRLVISLGAKYDPDINSNTTHLICGRIRSTKYTKAQGYANINIVNHIWLEECYQRWEMVDFKADDRYTYFPGQNTKLDDNAGKTHLVVDELALWMDPQTMPEFLPSNCVYEVNYNNSNDNDDNGNGEQGFINHRKRRRAAVKATLVLNDIVMPDVNAYEREIKQKRGH